MPRAYDSLVIGAGPAGASAAYHLATKGRRVLIVDRCEFPRPKTCGDALTPAAVGAVRRLGIERLPGLTLRGSRTIHLDTGDVLHQAFASHVPGMGVALERRDLDQVLVERARSAGADLLCARVARLVWREGRVIGASLGEGDDERLVEAGTTIAAIGARRARTLLHDGEAPLRNWCVAARAYLDASCDVGCDLEIYLPLRDQRGLSFGYAWIFPMARRRLNVGIGLFRSRQRGSPDLRRRLSEFLGRRAQVDPRLRGAQMIGAIESGPILMQPWNRRVLGLLPVGDFAGLANPLTAEGIGPAIESGELAAAASLHDEELAADRYLELLHSRFASRYRLAPALRGLYDEPWAFLSRGADLILRPNATSGEALRRLSWDEPESTTRRDPPAADVVERGIAANAERVRRDIARAAGRLRPTLAELADQVMSDVRSGFGVFVGFGTICGAMGSESAVRIWKVLETLNLIALLHGDTVGAERGRSWGGDTLNLLLADSLNVVALKRIYALDGRWARFLADAAADLMGSMARQSGGVLRRDQNSRGSWDRLFRAAALAGDSPERALSATAERWIVQVSRARLGGPLRLADLRGLLLDSRSRHSGELRTTTHATSPEAATAQLRS